MANLELKDVLLCALTAEKDLSTMYNTAANEALSVELASEFMDILGETHEAQYNIFKETHERGFYPTPMADENKVKELKQKFCKCTSN